MSLLARVHRTLSLGVLAALYFGLLTPVALVLRLFGRDALRLRQSHASSYWIDRGVPPPVESLDRPF